MTKAFLLLFFAMLFTQPVFAEYVLPYPGPMPGNKLYKIVRAIDAIQLYWSWGNIAKTRYFMDLTDKYVVEAKTLFEYKQYLLGVNALQRSDSAWKQITPYLDQAEQEGKDIGYLRMTHQEQSQMHQRLITQLITMLPPSFTWTPEKSNTINLELHQMLEASLHLRQ